jgi:hypothetical protein
VAAGGLTSAARTRVASPCARKAARVNQQMPKLSVSGGSVP